MEIIEVNVTEEVINIVTEMGAYPLPTNVISVFGRSGVVVAANGDYTTTQVTEGTNLYYTEARVNANTNVAANTAARHNAVTIGTANGLSLSTQALSLAAASTSTTGALTSTDWNTFNGKQAALNGTGFVKISGTTISYDNTSYLPLGGGTLTGGVSGTTATFSGILTTPQVKAATSAGLSINANSGTQVADFGAGGSANITFFGGLSGTSASFSSSITGNTIVKSGGTAAQILAADGSVITAGTNITISGGTISSAAGMAIGGSITSATAGSVLFAGTSGVLAQDNANFFWDDTNDRLGLGTVSPNSRLHISGSTTAASAIARGANLTSTLVAAANSDVLVGLDITPTFTNGAFTGVANYGLRLSNSQAFFGGSGGTAILIQSSTAIRTVAATNGTMYIDSSADLTGNLFLRATTLNFPSGTASSSAFNISPIATFSNVVNFNSIGGIASFRLVNTTSSATWYFENNRNAPSGSLEISNSLSNPTITAFSTRNVAINSNTDSGFRLDVNGTARVSGQLTANSFVPTSSTIPTNGMYLSGTNTLGFATNGTLDMVLDANGALGIGVTNMSSYNGGGNQFVIGGGGFRGLTIAGTTEGNIYFADGTSGADTYRGVVGYNHTTNYLFFFSDATERMRLFSTGNLGINTTTDAGFRLDVNGTARVQGDVSLSYAAPRLAMTATTSTNATYMTFTNSNGIAYVGSDNSTGSLFNGEAYAFNIAIGGTKSIFLSTQNSTFKVSGSNSCVTIGSNTDILSAALNVVSTTKGFLPPRMTTSEKNAIFSPATGLVVFDTTLGKLCVFATTWQTISST